MLSDSSKRIVQISQLLDERRLSLSLSINRKELVVVSGLALLWQNAQTKHDGKIAQESQKLVGDVIGLLNAESTSAAGEFSMLANTLISRDGTAAEGLKTRIPYRAPPRQVSSMQRQLWKVPHPGLNLAARQQEPSRRATVSGGSPLYAAAHPQAESIPARASIDVVHPASGFPTTPVLSLDHRSRSARQSSAQSSDVLTEPTPKSITTTSDWEYVVSDMDRGFSNIFTGIYGGKDCGDDGGPFATITAEYGSKPPSQHHPLPLGLDGMPTTEPWAAPATAGGGGPDAQSVFSYSEESLASVADTEAASFLDPFRGIVMPTAEAETLDGFELGNGWNRRLAV